MTRGFKKPEVFPQSQPQIFENVTLVARQREQFRFFFGDSFG